MAEVINFYSTVGLGSRYVARKVVAVWRIMGTLGVLRRAVSRALLNDGQSNNVMIK